MADAEYLDGKVKEIRIIHGAGTYSFFYVSGQEQRVIDSVTKMAENPDHPFGERDLACIKCILGRLSREQLVEILGRE